MIERYHRFFCLNLVSIADLFRLVTQRSWWGGALRDAPGGEERCVTSLKTAAMETSLYPLSKEGTNVTRSFFLGVKVHFFL